MPEAAGSGGVDMQALKKLLEANKHRPRIIGAFTAASNITGAHAYYIMLFRGRV